MTMSLRRYLTIKVLSSGASWPVAAEAVSSTALEHPEWDMDEEREWGEWESAFS